MATFDQLSAEQRAIIELVLKQGQSYEELGGMLGMDVSRVRELARESLVRLSPVSAAAVDDDWRGQLADYLLNQQAGPEATATKGHLRRSEAARGWARSVLDSLEQFYDANNLPSIPEGDPAAAEPRRPRREKREREPRAPREKRERAPRRKLSPDAEAALRRRRLVGGALAIAVLALGVFGLTKLFGDDGDDNRADTTQTASNDVRLVGQLPLEPVEGLEGSRDAAGLAAIAERGDQRQLIVQAQLPRTKNREAYEVWLYNSDSDAFSIGAQVTDPRGLFQGANQLPEDVDLNKYRFIDVSLEPVDGPEGHSGQSVLRGRLDQLAPPPEPAGGTSTAPDAQPQTAPEPEAEQP